jgi:hypothetical protein
MRKYVIATAMLLGFANPSSAVFLDGVADDSYVIHVRVAPPGEPQSDVLYTRRIFGDEEACKAVLAGKGDDANWPDALRELGQIVIRAYGPGALKAVNIDCITVAAGRQYVAPKKEESF